MNVYLLPHHRFDPRFRYTLERENIGALDGTAAASPDQGFWGRLWQPVRQAYRKLKLDYDQVVHGHEQIRLSRLVLMMDRDPDLTLVVPAGMGRDAALVAIHGVIRAGLMALRSHAVRNVVTALVMAIVLFGATPTHFAAVIFYPLIALYAWGRYWEDRLIRRTMHHLLEVELAGNGREHFREEPHLSKLEETFARTARPDTAYRDAIKYLDSLDHREDGQAPPEHLLMYRYYSDIGRLDPYERYQDRIRKKLVETIKLVVHHLWEFWKATFRWTLRPTQVLGVRVPNILFVLLGTVATVHATIWVVTWRGATSQTFPHSVRAIVDFAGYSTVEVESRRESAADANSADPIAPVQTKSFGLVCPIDSAQIDLWPVVAQMIADHEKHGSGQITCPGETHHKARYRIKIKY
jgi:hypothetical protein